MSELRDFRNPSGAKALIFGRLFGTAEAVPFQIRQIMDL